VELELAELKVRPEYKLLTTPQRTWLDSYITSGGDGEAATKAAFSTTTEGSMKVQTRRMLDHPVVSQLVALWTGAQKEPTRDEWRSSLWKLGGDSATPASARVAALVAYGADRGWTKAAPANSTEDDRAKLLEEIDA
jgi:hypothetical protein